MNGLKQAFVEFAGALNLRHARERAEMNRLALARLADAQVVRRERRLVVRVAATCDLCGKPCTSAPSTFPLCNVCLAKEVA